jgi:hypothetical protein
VPMQRLFIIAPSVARLIRKERKGERVLEGYFPDQPHRSTYVQIEEASSSLILEAGSEEAPEERADLPLAHAQALLAVSQGQVEYVRTRLSIGSHEIQALHFIRPAPFDLVVVVPSESEQDFHPLPCSARRSALSLPISAVTWLSRVVLRMHGMWMSRTGLSTACSTCWRTGSLLGQGRTRLRSQTPRRLMSLRASRLLSRNRNLRWMRRSTTSTLRTRSSVSWPVRCNHGSGDR